MDFGANLVIELEINENRKRRGDSAVNVPHSIGILHNEAISIPGLSLSERM